jgi:hypothetical protein
MCVRYLFLPKFKGLEGVESSLTGKNLRLVHEVTQLNPWTTSYDRLKVALEEEELVGVPMIDRWRPPYLRSLLCQMREAHILDLINSLVIK